MRSGAGFYNRDGDPIGMDEWMLLRRGENEGYWRVGESEADGVRVSTVWLGMDHQWGDGPPLIFETMVFEGPHDEQMWRWSTEMEALAGHAEIASAVLRAPLRKEAADGLHGRPPGQDEAGG